MILINHFGTLILKAKLINKNFKNINFNWNKFNKTNQKNKLMKIIQINKIKNYLKKFYQRQLKENKKFLLFNQIIKDMINHQTAL